MCMTKMELDPLSRCWLSCWATLGMDFKLNHHHEELHWILLWRFVFAHFPLFFCLTQIYCMFVAKVGGCLLQGQLHSFQGLEAEISTDNGPVLIPAAVALKLAKSGASIASPECQVQVPVAGVMAGMEAAKMLGSKEIDDAWGWGKYMPGISIDFIYAGDVWKPATF